MKGWSDLLDGTWRTRTYGDSPASPRERARFETAHQTTLGAIFYTLGPGPRLRVKAETLEDQWEQLKHYRPIRPRQSTVLRSIFKQLRIIKLKDFENVQSYADKLIILQTQMAAISDDSKIGDSF